MGRRNKGVACLDERTAEKGGDTPVGTSGAVEKTRIGLTLLTKQMLVSGDAELAALPARWLQKLLDAVRAAGCSVNEMHRRSAGLPYAFLALFMAEPQACPKVRPLRRAPTAPAFHPERVLCV